jgi:16S rRNA processing protein RimM
MQTDHNGRPANEAEVEEIYDVAAGVIIGAHGVQGAVKIKLATDTALALIQPVGASKDSSIPVWIARLPKSVAADSSQTDTQTGQILKIKQIKELQAGGRVLLLKLQGITDRNQAEALIGLNVYAPKARRAALDSGEYFTEDLIGLQAITESGRKLGKVTAVLQQPANDVYETDLGALIPAVKAIVKSVDITARSITVIDMAGLLPEEAEELAPDDNGSQPIGEPEAE